MGEVTKPILLDKTGKEMVEAILELAKILSGTTVRGEDGKDGEDGVSATHSWDGTVLTITSASGTSSSDLKGEKGDRGEDGRASMVECTFDANGNVTFSNLPEGFVEWLQLAGGIMKGDIDMDGHKITGLPEPTSASEPATKEFVENFNITGNTYVATDDNNDGNVVIRPYVPSFDIDATLTTEGKAADAKATGDALAGKAPSGYGLGELSLGAPVDNDANNAVHNGWFNMYASTANGLSTDGVIIANSRSWGQTVQIAITINGQIYRRYQTNGNWGGWIQIGGCDAIVEQGTSGIWGYRKWANGIAECWCRHSTTATPSNNLNGVYYSPSISVPFPFQFTGVPTISVGGGSTNVVNWIREFASTAVQVTYIVCSNTNTGGCNVVANIHAIGRWK